MPEPHDATWLLEDDAPVTSGLEIAMIVYTHIRVAQVEVANAMVHHLPLEDEPLFRSLYNAQSAMQQVLIEVQRVREEQRKNIESSIDGG